MADAKINRERKTFVFDDGEEIPIPADKVKQVLRSPYAKKFKEEEKAAHKKMRDTSWFPALDTAVESAHKSFLGDLPSQAFDYARAAGKGISSKGQEGLGFLDRIQDIFYAAQEARKENLSEMQEAHPVAANIGKGVGMIGELAALRKLPGVAALPIMGAAHSETSLLDPLEKGKEVGKDAAAGFVLDRFFKGLGNISKQRGARRAGQEAIKNTEAANLAEIARTEGLNAAEQARVAQETAVREGALAQQPLLQEGANQNFFLESAQNIGRALKAIGRQSVGAESMGVEEFIENAINTSHHAASKEGGYATRFLRSIFKGDKEGKLTSDSIKKGMRALDEGIAKNGGTSREILTDYKSFLQKRLPENLSGSYAFSKWSPRIVSQAIKNLEGDVSKLLQISPVVQQDLTQKLGADFSKKLTTSFEKAAKDVVEKYKGNFVGGISGGTLEKEIADALRATPEYQKVFNRVKNFSVGKRSEGFNSSIVPGYTQVEQVITGLPDAIGQRFSQTVSDVLPEIQRDMRSVFERTGRNLSNVPSSPQMVPPPPPVAPASIAQPNLQTPPPLPEPQGLMGRLAHGIENLREKPISETVGDIKSMTGLGFLGKLAGIPVATAGAIGGAGYAALRGATSPGMAGQLAREVGEGAARAIHLVNSMAEKYPSFKNGVIEDPQERRSLTKEIEDDSQISLSEKALLQSKVNRGKPLGERLQ